MPGTEGRSRLKAVLRNGLGLAYYPRGQGASIVLLHPIGLDHRSWEYAADHLPGRYRQLAVDLRGHGRSDIPTSPFALDDLASDVAELLGALGAPSIVVGASMGGMVAQLVAIGRPDLVSALVLADTAASFTAATRAVLRERARTVASRGMGAIIDETLRRWFSRDFAGRRPDVVRVVRTWLMASDPTIHAWSWSAIAELDTEATLARLRVPALVITGSADVSTPPEIGRVLAERAGAAYAEIDGAGHMSHIERPEEFGRLVTDFLGTAGV